MARELGLGEVLVDRLLLVGRSVEECAEPTGARSPRHEIRCEATDRGHLVVTVTVVVVIVVAVVAVSGGWCWWW